MLRKEKTHMRWDMSNKTANLSFWGSMLRWRLWQNDSEQKNNDGHIYVFNTYSFPHTHWNPEYLPSAWKTLVSNMCQLTFTHSAEKNYAFTTTVTTMDEMWITQINLKKKLKLCQWKHVHSPPLKKSAQK